MTGIPPPSSPLRNTAARLGPLVHRSLTLENGGSRRHPSPIHAGHITLSFPGLSELTPRSAEAVLSLEPGTSPHLWAGVEDLHRDLLGRWVRAPGHAALLDHGEDPPVRPPSRPSRAPSAHGRGRPSREQRGVAQPAPGAVAQPDLRLHARRLAALSARALLSAAAAAAASAPEGSASPPAPPWFPPRAAAPPLEPLHRLRADNGRVADPGWPPERRGA